MWLALETATDRASVAVGRAAADAVEESLSGARRHAVEPIVDIDGWQRCSYSLWFESAAK